VARLILTSPSLKPPGRSGQSNPSGAQGFWHTEAHDHPQLLLAAYQWSDWESRMRHPAAAAGRRATLPRPRPPPPRPA
jgi:hypothetical protein